MNDMMVSMISKTKCVDVSNFVIVVSAHARARCNIKGAGNDHISLSFVNCSGVHFYLKPAKWLATRYGANFAQVHLMNNIIVINI